MGLPLPKIAPLTDISSSSSSSVLVSTTNPSSMSSLDEKMMEAMQKNVPSLQNALVIQKLYAERTMEVGFVASIVGKLKTTIEKVLSPQ